MKEKTFEELIEEGLSTIDDFDDVPVLMLSLLQQVREATIAEAVNHCVSQDWVKTIDNLKKMPIDRIDNFEKSPTEQ